MRYVLALLMTLLAAGFVLAGELLCNTCHKRIKGRYTSYDNHAYCSEACLTKALPKCDACHLPLRGKSLRFNGHVVCSEACAETYAPKCATCSRPIIGSYTEKQTPYGKRYVCPSCMERDRCFVCQMPAWRAVDSGRFICETCYETAITDEDEAQRLLNGLRGEVEALLKKRTTCKINFQLVTFDELARLTGKGPDDEPGRELGLYVHTVTTRTNPLTGRTTESKSECSIYILRNLPLDTYRDVAAHELAHNWMAHHMPQEKDLREQEGFAEYVAAQIDAAYGMQTLVQMKEDNSDPIYGEGYRIWRRRVSKQK